ncbi:hypothetical protein PRUPE_7G214800 [Prunus persica]|uniref:Uncharacterized protein n=1 Tax=Prunus persica TaxID=3760 RepID=M5VQG1_PRUPE|nr:uncharacterized protein LOC18769115 [Prunus persica]ONH97863.1 hypothetical protein PRUPE_7G214800 [Prunus persica]
MLILHTCAPVLQSPNTSLSLFPSSTSRFPPFCTVKLPFRSFYAQPGQPRKSVFVAKAGRGLKLKTEKVSEGEDDKEHDFIDIEAEVEAEAEDRFSGRGGFTGREEEKDFDRDPEFAEIMGACLDDPQKARSKMEDRLRKKRNKILHTKSGSGVPMNVTFNNFGFSNSYIWFEFYNTPLEQDVSLISDTFRSWHIIGRMGGCNSMNMQLSQSPLDKRPSYDAIQGANVTPTTFYNIGDLEIQDNLARVWVDIGTTEPLLLDVLINALTQISSDFVGIKQVVFGGSEFENWKENLTSEDAGYSVHNI